MSIRAHSICTQESSSRKAGIEAGRSIRENLGNALKIAAVYMTDNHDHGAFLEGITTVLGADVPVVGCLGQGVMSNGQVIEDTYAASVLGIGGDVIAASGHVENVQEDTFRKGAALGRLLKSSSGESPKVAVIHFDSICSMDVDQLLAGLESELDCPIIGGASGHAFFFEPLKDTFQFWGKQVLQKSAVGFTLAGDFSFEMGVSHGCAPVGVDLVVTKADGNRLIELDGRPAIEVWEEFCDSSDIHTNRSTALVLGIPVKSGDSVEYRMRGAYSLDPELGVVLGTAVEEGTEIALHHRTVDEIMGGTRTMGETLKQRLGDRAPRAVLGFECGSRAKPFLGLEGSKAENVMLQALVGSDAAWAGLLAWGELYPAGERASFHNYAFPLLVLAD